jgi:hypothetical protein
MYEKQQNPKTDKTTAAAMYPGAMVVFESLLLLVLDDELLPALGPAVGTSEAVSDTVGLWVGEQLGAVDVDGAFEGAAVGDFVGLLVGARVGDLVGPLGRFVGCPVGDEGFGVGETVGMVGCEMDGMVNRKS